MIIKICGLTPRTPLDQIATLPVHWGGLIFVETSPRYVGPKPFALPANLKRVGVFRDMLPHHIQTLSREWHLDYVQLHGHETPSMVAELKACGCDVVKTIHVQGPRDLERADRYEDADYLLFDRVGGGTGKKFDWAWLSSYTYDKPFLLAGGIGPDDAAALAAMDHPALAGFDLNSRFERAPGEKDPALLYEFLHHELPR